MKIGADEVIQAMKELPPSPPKRLYIKDYLKGFALVALFFIADNFPAIQKAATGYDFGEYKDLVSILIFATGWFIQRYYKDNR